MANDLSNNAGGLLRGSLPKGEGKLVHEAYRQLTQNIPALQNAPQAVCFTVSELRAFLDSVEKTVNPDPSKPVPPEQIGVAIMPAVRNKKVTFVLAATRFTEDKAAQKVLSINNPITGIFPVPKNDAKNGDDPDPQDPPVDDNSYDTGSTFP